MDYLDRTDTDTLNEVPNFIYQAEQRIARESKTLGIVIYVTNTFTVGVSVYQKPANWRRNLTLNYGTGTGSNTRNQIKIRSYEFIRDYWPTDTQTGPPKFYCDYGFSNFLVAPTPDIAYPFELGYLALPEPISVINQTNWLTNYAPDVLLYATLLEAVPFLKNDERVPIWERYYQRGLESMNAQDDMRITDRASNRDAD
jgi:hypothetical protein